MDNSETYFTDEETIDEPEKQDFSFLEGVCRHCLDTGFKHILRDGILGIAYTDYHTDSDGVPVKKLLICNHQ